MEYRGHTITFNEANQYYIREYSISGGRKHVYRAEAIGVGRTFALNPEQTLIDIRKMIDAHELVRDSGSHAV